jgi:hypothetical protein
MDRSRFILRSSYDDAFPIAFWGWLALVMMMAIIAAS